MEGAKSRNAKKTESVNTKSVRAPLQKAGRKPKAEKLMLDVHHKGKAVVDSGSREAMERNVEVLHGYGLWATVRQDA